MLYHAAFVIQSLNQAWYNGKSKNNYIPSIFQSKENNPHDEPLGSAALPIFSKARTTLSIFFLDMYDDVESVATYSYYFMPYYICYQ
jgi:hypothetical protein